MRLPSIVKKAYKKLLKNQFANSECTPDIDKWDEYLELLGPAMDYVDASYKKYQCRVFSYSRFARVFMNVTSFFALFAYLPFALKKSKKLSADPVEGRAFFEIDAEVGYEDIFPAQLRTEYPTIVSGVKDKLYVGELCEPAKEMYLICKKAHPFEFEYRLWLIKELARHSKYLLEENPAATIIYVNERNVASPLLKKLYEDDGRKLISFMHGDYLFQIVLAYAAFSTYFFWDQFYIDKFTDRERWNCGNYEVYVPHRLNYAQNEENALEQTIFLTYYCSGESERSISLLKDIFKKIEEKGLTCKVRPHPRDSHVDLIMKVFPVEQIELPEQCTIQESLMQTRYPVGLMTTVLSEAIAARKEIVIDDITEPAKYNNLLKQDAIIFNKDFVLLSSLLKDLCGYSSEK